MKSKKALSPLVATVLLIAFAIALGAVVMSWGIGQVNEPSDSEKTNLVPQECSPAEISLKYGIGEKPCYDTNDFILAAFIDNGPKELSGLKVVIYGSSGVSEMSEGVIANNDQGAIKEGDSVLIAVNYGNDKSSIDKVEIIPKVRPYGASEEIECISKKIEISDIKKSETCYK